MATGVLPVSHAATQTSDRMSAGAWAWALYQGFRDPSNMVINIYVFMPYFAAVVVGDAVVGQARVAQMATVVGLLVAITAPLLGAALDRLGARKPWLMLATACHAAALATLWFSGAGLGVLGTLAVLVLCGLFFQFADVLFVAMLPYAAPASLTARASGLGQALGNIMSVAVLVLVLWLFILPGQVAAPFVPAAPLLGLDPVLHEPQRFAGPLTAAVLVLGSLPLFLLTRDAPPTGTPARRAIAAAPRELWRSVQVIRGDRDGLIFLISRMLYTDGLVTMLVFTGVYTAGVFRWAPLDLLAFGLTASAAAAVGGIVAGRLDNAIGPRRALMLELGVCIVGGSAQLGMGLDRLLYLPYRAEPVWGGPVFKTLPELLYLGIGLFTAAGICAVFASSRTLLVRIAPPDRLGGYLGLFALSGQATAWVGPLFVGLATATFASQRAGFAIIFVLMGLGLFGLIRLRREGYFQAEPVGDGRGVPLAPA